MSKKVLEEKLLSSDFTFGFELEAEIKYWNMPVDTGSDDYKKAYQKVLDIGFDYDSGKEPENYEEPFTYGDFCSEFESNVRDERDGATWNDIGKTLLPFKKAKELATKELSFDKYFPEGSKWIVSPSKGITYDGSLDMGGFEYRSPVLKFTPEAISACIEFLKDVKKTFYISDDCGFHTHLAFNGITEEDAIWITLKLATNLDLVDKFGILDLYTDKKNEFSPISFESDWAGTEYLDRISEYIEDEDYESLAEELSNEKYRFLRIHPQGTLEWRAPRGFLEQSLNENYIKSFFLKLYKFVEWMRKVLDEKTLEGCDLDRDNLMEIIKSDKKYPLFNKKYSSQDNNMIAKVSSDVSYIFKLKNVPVSKLIKIFNTFNNKEHLMHQINDLVKQGYKLSENLFVSLFVVMAQSNYRDYLLKMLLEVYDDNIPFSTIRKYYNNDFIYPNILVYMSEENIINFIKFIYNKRIDNIDTLVSYFLRNIIKKNELTNDMIMTIMEVSDADINKVMDLVNTVKSSKD